MRAIGRFFEVVFCIVLTVIYGVYTIGLMAYWTGKDILHARRRP